MAGAARVSIHPAPREVQIAAENLQVAECEAAKSFRERLPAGWIACCTEAGEVYYHDPGRGVSQWSHPSASDDRERRPHTLAKELVKRPDGSVPEKGPMGRHSVYDARSRHVPLETPQSLFSDVSMAFIRREDLSGRAFALHGLLSASEAAAYCHSAARSGFAGSDVGREFPAELRNNARLVHFSDALAAALWRRLAPALCHRDIFMLQPMGFGAEGRWKPCGVNPCFRISRYQQGEHFAQHCDGMYANDDGECSIYSLVLYLNDDYEGGELEFSNSSVCFKPSVGTAVLFPHDMPHAGLKVQRGTKYVARTELMFRCIERQRPPKEPRFAKDPLFQRMAALYEHIGDLVALGDVDATTKAYQEALGIQIAHQGTEVVQHVLRSVLEDKTWEAILSFLDPLEVCRAGLVSQKWREISSSGMLWRSWFKQRWPSSDEILRGETYALDSDLHDWMGSYRREHLLSSRACVSVIFPAACIFSYDSVDGSMHGPVPASAHHSETGIGWDRTLKQRQGWRFGKGTVYQRQRGYRTWHENGSVDFTTLPEIFAWCFHNFKLRPSEQHLIVPTLPGLTMGGTTQERLATILHRRFQVPRLSFASAPLCALAAHGLKTGTVLWGCAFGTCSVFCFYEEELLANYGRWDFESATVEDVVQHVATAKKELNAAVATSVLQHVVISCQPCIGIKEENPRRGYGYGSCTIEVDDDLRDWADPEDVAQQLKEALGDGFTTLEIHPSSPGDVCRGAVALAERLPLAMPASVPESWEWRVLAQGQWHPLSPYMSGVFEGALRHDKPLATVQLNGRLGLYLVANLEDFTVTLAEALSFRGEGINDLEQVHCVGSWCPLTRFLRGRPSTEPDRRKPEELETKEPEEVQEVAGCDALHVRTLAGKLVFSQKRSSRQHFHDLLAECAQQMKTSQRRLQLLDGTTRIQCDEELQKVMEAPELGVLDLSVLVGPEPPVEHSVNKEAIPEDLPGEMKSSCALQRALLAALRNLS